MPGPHNGQAKLKPLYDVAMAIKLQKYDRVRLNAQGKSQVGRHHNPERKGTIQNPSSRRHHWCAVIRWDGYAGNNTVARSFLETLAGEAVE